MYKIILSTKVNIEVTGMTCASCAAGVDKVIKKHGATEVDVSYQNNEAFFLIDDKTKVPQIVEAINKIGYKANLPDNSKKEEKDYSYLIKLGLSLLFTIPLWLHMFSSVELLHSPLFQLICSVPVILVGIWHFGKSAWYSIKLLVPNMDVLIILGAAAAFFYSLYGSFFYMNGMHAHQFMYFETAASIICFALTGKYLEHLSVKRTTTAVMDLTKLKVEKALLVITNGSEVVYQEVKSSDLKIGDIILVKEGAIVPQDGIIKSGNALLDESMITGESIPIEKSIGAKVVGSTILSKGIIEVEITATEKDSTLEKIIQLVKSAQQKKPKIQQIGDKVSAIFVPSILIISSITFLLAYFIFNIEFKPALLQAIAVLVISCPCAMGLATPTAIAVAIGIAAKRGILIKGANTLEDLSKADVFIFDKTGTLTTGNFGLSQFKNYSKIEDERIKEVVTSLEQFSTHPIAMSLRKIFSINKVVPVNEVDELKGLGIKGLVNGVEVLIASKNGDVDVNAGIHDVYVHYNNKLVAGINIKDEIKTGALELIQYLNNKGIKTVMLSGDKLHKCNLVASQLGITEVYAEQVPQQKTEVIQNISKEHKTVMVGDGINDAPALSLAHMGISLSKASDAAIQSAQIVLTGPNELIKLKEAVSLSDKTLLTIKQNYFWAFIYNILAIPFAAFGYLSPMIASLSMAFSDVVVVGNSLLLKKRKI